MVTITPGDRLGNNPWIRCLTLVVSGLILVLSPRLGAADQGYHELQDAVPLAGGAPVLWGQSSSSTALHLVRLDAAGNVLWSRARSTTEPEASCGYNLLAPPDGSVVSVGGALRGAEGRGVLCKVDPSGNLEWAKSYFPENQLSDEFFFHDVEAWDDGSLLVKGAMWAWLTMASPFLPFVVRVGSGGFLTGGTAFGDPDVFTSVSLSGVRPLPDGGAYAVGTTTFESDFFLMRLDPGLDPAWRRVVTVGGDPRFSGLRRNSRDEAVLTVYDAADDTAFWLFFFDPSGNLLRARQYADGGVRLRGSVVDVAAGDGLLIVGWHAGPPVPGTLIMRTDDRGEILWQKVYDFTAKGRNVWLMPGGEVRAMIDAGGGHGVLVELDTGGIPRSGCIASWDVSLLVSDLPATISTPGPLVTTYLGPGGGGIAVDVSGRAVSTFDPCGCPRPTERIQGIQAVRSGTENISITWEADPEAAAYHVWTVSDRLDIDRARQASSPPAQGVPGCSPPAPMVGTTCVHEGAVLAAPLLYYQVRGVCSAGLEGP